MAYLLLSANAPGLVPWTGLRRIVDGMEEKEAIIGETVKLDFSHCFGRSQLLKFIAEEERRRTVFPS
jgi:hypothetical protein